MVEIVTFARNEIMCCILHISGVNFNVDAFIAKSNVRPYKVFYKGEPRLKTKPYGQKMERSGLSILVSKADFDNMERQVKDATSYLKRNKQKLMHIARTKGIQYATLDFGIDCQINGEKQLVQSEVLPSKLLQLAGNLKLSIELSLYARNMQELMERIHDQE